MTRSDASGKLLFDSEIEKTAKQLRKEARLRKLFTPETAEPNLEDTSLTSLFASEPEEDVSSESNSESEEEMGEQTLRQMAAARPNNQPLAIEYPDLEAACELKSGLIHLLPKFHGMESENPHKHLKEFHVVCLGMRPHNVTEEQIKMRAFPFSLVDAAKEWLLNLPPRSIRTWVAMEERFLEKYFPASRAAVIRREISGIGQKETETLNDYWERFKKLCASCPQHGIAENSLIQYFYEGMSSMERKMIDATSGGCLLDKTPTAAKDLIQGMAATSQQFGKPKDSTRKTYEVSAFALEEKINALTSLVQNMAAGKTAQVKACGICSMTGHATDECPTLQEESAEQLNAIGGYSGQPQRKHDPYSTTYNPGWRDHPNLSYGTRPNYQQRPQNNSALQQGLSIDEIVKELATNAQQFQKDTQQFQKETKASIQNLEKQMGQMATSIGAMESQGKLPSQTVDNPRQNVSAIKLRNGREIEQPEKSDSVAEKEIEKETVIKRSEKPEGEAAPQVPPLVIPPPFTHRLSKSKKEKEERDILEVALSESLTMNSDDMEESIIEIVAALEKSDRQVNGHRLKPFYEGFQAQGTEGMTLEVPETEH
ncbi:hypothetical protein M5689_013115 [Euphorbia peplus]|nr:hypothetical protein M5689_013115 [Euphorbia peplus]